MGRHSTGKPMATDTLLKEMSYVYPYSPLQLNVVISKITMGLNNY
jgi:hypothetical protein